MQAVAELDRALLGDWYRRNRLRSAQLFALVAESAYYSRPIALRHPFIFYEGHLPAFSYLTLNERALEEPALDASLEKLFERGIDPGSQQDAACLTRDDWPSRDAVRAFSAACDRRVEAALAEAALVNPGVPRLARGQAAFTILEHEQMHHETLFYILHQLDEEHKGRIAQTHRDAEPPAPEIVAVPAGIATLGAQPDEIEFGWDNEFGREQVDVAAFGIDRYPVTNADWLRFVADGGPVPRFWIESAEGWRLRGVFEELPLPQSWPVYVTHRQARAYARWAGRRLPTEAEYHRAAYGSPAGERPHPWGGDAPAPVHGNFD
ncbi:MAG TPA: SUMF1/EgtB/PvdO family nonheme iron enzyme, partial [Candidatus Tumulicola sp.]|nr:SUMF1/EgtB/PvdO family nonheme iron enzyme [Candidatus Tumulicola sp.]